MVGEELQGARNQWDPERDAGLQPLPWRAIQIGLGPGVVDAYVDEWIVGIQDVTDLAVRVRAGEGARPVERPYPVPADTAVRLGMG